MRPPGARREPRAQRWHHCDVLGRVNASGDVASERRRVQDQTTLAFPIRTETAHATCALPIVRSRCPTSGGERHPARADRLVAVGPRQAAHGLDRRPTSPFRCRYRPVARRYADAVRAHDARLEGGHDPERHLRGTYRSWAREHAPTHVYHGQERVIAALGPGGRMVRVLVESRRRGGGGQAAVVPHARRRWRGPPHHQREGGREHVRVQQGRAVVGVSQRQGQRGAALRAGDGVARSWHVGRFTRAGPAHEASHRCRQLGAHPRFASPLLHHGRYGRCR